MTAPPLLVPRPQSVEHRPGVVRVDAGLAREVDELLSRRRLRATSFEPRRGLGLFTGMPADHPEAYLLTIEPAEREGIPVSISAAGDAGIRQGLRTLRQLLRQYGPRLPCLTVEDRPAFATRGLMLDISRDKVPTLEELKRTVDLLASLKFNHLQLYTEHTFAYRGHEEVWAGASPLTPEEVRELDAYAAGRGVELAANQNCFGHLAVWLKRPRYSHLAEIEGDNAWKFMQWERRGPFSLCPVLPESEAFVRELLGQLLPCFQSPLVNIGCDETFDVGFGRSRDAVAALVAEASVASASSRCPANLGEAESFARATLFFDFVNRICEIVRGHGKRPMMWADIALHHPDMLSRLGKDVIGIGWGYEPDAKFAEECGHLRAHGLSAWVAPGTSTWRSITGRTTEARGNMLAAAACAEQAEGFLVCDWGDVGHMQHWPLTMLRLADAAEAAWNGPAARFNADHTRAASVHVFDDPGQHLAHWLNQLGDLDLPLRTRCRVRNASAIFNDLFPPVPPGPGRRALGDAPLEEWDRLAARLEELAAARPTAADSLVNEELEHTLAFARLAVEHGRSCRRSADGLAPRSEDREGLRAQAATVLDGLRRLWPARNRPGGLEQASSHLRRLIETLR